MQNQQVAADQAALLPTTDALPEAEDEVRELRAQVAEYQRIFDKAAPRLAAFRQLEEIARDRKTDPESVAAEAALEVLKRDQIELTQRRDNLEKEVAMLLGRKQDEIEIIDDITIESNDIHQEVGEILDELLLLKEDAVRLMSEKSDLELNIQALKLELALLQEKKVKAKELDLDAPEHAVGSRDVTSGTSAGGAKPNAKKTDDNKRADNKADNKRADNKKADRESSEERASAKADSVKAETLLDPRPGKACDFDAESENEEEESRLFDEFFHAQVEHDKARDWMLG